MSRAEAHCHLFWEELYGVELSRASCSSVYYSGKNVLRVKVQGTIVLGGISCGTVVQGKVFRDNCLGRTKLRGVIVLRWITWGQLSRGLNVRIPTLPWMNRVLARRFQVEMLLLLLWLCAIYFFSSVHYSFLGGIGCFKMCNSWFTISEMFTVHSITVTWFL